MTSSTSRPRLAAIRTLLWVSSGISLVVLGLSMVMLGHTSYWVSPAAVACTLAFNIVHLALHGLRQIRKRHHKSNPTDKSLPGTSPSSLCHAVSIALAFLISLVWIGALVASMIVITSSENPNSPRVRAYNRDPKNTPRLPASYIETVFILVEASLMLWVGLLSLEERKTFQQTESSVEQVELASRFGGSGPVVVVDPSVVDAARAKGQSTIYALLWTLFVSSAAGFVSAMINKGRLTYYASPLIAGSTFIFSLTLITLLARDSPTSSVGFLPSTSRTGSIVFAFTLIPLSITNLIVATGRITGWYQSTWDITWQDYDNFNALFAEPAMIGLSFLVLVPLFILCAKQRRRLLALGGQQLGWWRLGEHRV